MPELPEVETTRRALEDAVGRRIVGVEVPGERVLRRDPSPASFAARLLGRRVTAVDRHGKWLFVRLDDGNALALHLGMSGRLSTAGDGRHVRLVLELDDGTEVRFVDPRTFGMAMVLTPEEVADLRSRLGPDALEPPELGGRLAGRRAPVKALLLDQRILAGLGNIYADEALHRAGISPHRPGGSLTTEEVERLRRAIVEVLRGALGAGGTTLGDRAYLLPDGRAGEQLARLEVYGRAEAPCRRCGGPVRRDRIRGRSAHWCPRCQR